MKTYVIKTCVIVSKRSSVKSVFEPITYELCALLDPDGMQRDRKLSKRTVQNTS